MTGRETDECWQLRVKASEEEIEPIISIINSHIGWAYQEKETEKELIIYFKRKPNPEKLKKILNRAFSIEKAPRWEEKFKETFKGVEVGPFFIRPPWVTPCSTKTDIIIYPASGFGTGEHETTQGMILMIWELFKQKTYQRVLDIGTGSGILAIVCSKLKAKSVIAIDKDELAISNAKENLKLNDVKNVKLILGKPESIKGKFDLILANIDFFTLIENAAVLKELADDSLILSGFLEEDQNTIKDIYMNLGFDLIKTISLNDWVTVSLRIRK